MLYTLTFSPVSPKILGNTESTSVIKNPTSTMNITGFLIIYIGFNFIKAPLTASCRISGVIVFDLFLWLIYSPS